MAGVVVDERGVNREQRRASFLLLHFSLHSIPGLNSFAKLQHTTPPYPSFPVFRDCRGSSVVDAFPTPYNDKYDGLVRSTHKETVRPPPSTPCRHGFHRRTTKGEFLHPPTRTSYHRGKAHPIQAERRGMARCTLSPRLSTPRRDSV
jgi:hypothetical protein